METAMPRTYLESLTTSDLIRMADNLGIDIPPDLDRIFIIEELLEIASLDDTIDDVPDLQTITAEDPKVKTEGSPSAEQNIVDSGLAESVPLPKHYNITYIEVMIRDPLWAFVFWEIKDQDKDHYEKAQDFEGYYLKVSPCGNKNQKKSLELSNPVAEAEGVFMVPVTPADTAWYLGLSPAGDPKLRTVRPEVCGSPPADQGYTFQAQNQYDEAQYKVELCASLKGNETVIAASSPFKLPCLHELSSGAAARCAEENPLVRLSGYGDFHILRNNERLFRIKKGSAAGSYE